jgi:hypothetical protein
MFVPGFDQGQMETCPQRSQQKRMSYTRPAIWVAFCALGLTVGAGLVYWNKFPGASDGEQAVRAAASQDSEGRISVTSFEKVNGQKGQVLARHRDLRTGVSCLGRIRSGLQVDHRRRRATAWLQDGTGNARSRIGCLGRVPGQR